MNDFESYYDVLEVSKTAMQDEIKKAFTKLAIQFHPDKNGGASDKLKKLGEQKFKEITEAYNVLKDVSKRKLYDTKIKEFEEQKQKAAQPSQAKSTSSGSGAKNSSGQTNSSQQIRANPQKIRKKNCTGLMESLV